MEEAIAAKLLATTALTTLVGTRIQWDQRPQANALPSVTLTVISGAPLYSDEGNTDLVNVRLQIDSWAKDTATQSGSSLAKLVAREVMAALATVHMTVSGVEFQGVFPDNIQDFSEQGQGGVQIYRRALDYDIWHEG